MDWRQGRTLRPAVLPLGVDCYGLVLLSTQSVFPTSPLVWFGSESLFLAHSTKRAAGCWMADYVPVLDESLLLPGHAHLMAWALGPGLAPCAWLPAWHDALVAGLPRA